MENVSTENTETWFMAGWSGEMSGRRKSTTAPRLPSTACWASSTPTSSDRKNTFVSLVLVSVFTIVDVKSM